MLEALIFASPQPLTPREIGQVLGGVPKPVWQAALEEMQADYARDGRGLQLVEVAGGWQITTRPEYNDWMRELLDPESPDAPVHPGAGDAGGDRLQAAGHAARDHRAARREVRRRAQDAAREAADPDHRPQGGGRPADAVRHHQGVPAALRPQGPGRAAQDRGVRRGPGRGGRRRGPEARDRGAAAGRGPAGRRGRCRRAARSARAARPPPPKRATRRRPHGDGRGDDEATRARKADGRASAEDPLARGRRVAPRARSRSWPRAASP